MAEIQSQWIPQQFHQDTKQHQEKVLSSTRDESSGSKEQDIHYVSQAFQHISISSWDWLNQKAWQPNICLCLERTKQNEDGLLPLFYGQEILYLYRL